MTQVSDDRMSRVLVVDTDVAVCRMLSQTLGGAGYQVRSVARVEQALDIVANEEFGIILADLTVPGQTGIESIHALKKASDDDAYLIMMAHSAQGPDISALQEGAYDYLSKPIKPDEALLVLKNAQEREQLYRENLRLKEEVDRSFGIDALVGHSPSMVHLKSVIHKFAPYKTSVLVIGESGTGKDLIARALHHASDRRDQALVAINCAAIPESLLESELFGHIKGAFTGAVRTRKGLVEDAHRGTLFLDEIAEMPVALQAKLLRVLETEEVRPVGGTRTVGVDVRIVCSTSRDLTKEVAAGRFREDLFYRINVLTLKVPPLRERKEDIPQLVEHFLEDVRLELKRRLRGVTPGAMKVFFEHNWPGNVRELEHVIERGAILSTDGWIDVDALPPEMLSPSAEIDREDLSIKRRVRSLERELISRALKRTRGNRTHAAAELEISHRALLYKIKEYEIHEGEER